MKARLKLQTIWYRVKLVRFSIMKDFAQIM
nr:MAG TPA: hypothetical protein [Bacteriophage sp.]